MIDTPFHDLGSDIIFCRDQEQLPEKYKGRASFLDYLWLPCSLSNLTEVQVLIINRYREQVISSQKQYKHMRIAHEILQAAIASNNVSSLIEIGCGKYPLDCFCDNHFGLDIDPEAIDHMINIGNDACLPNELASYEPKKFDFVASAFAMHFAIDEEFVSDLYQACQSHSVLCFNLIVDDSVDVLKKLSLLNKYWPHTTVLKTKHQSRREFFFVLAGDEGLESAKITADSIRNFSSG